MSFKEIERELEQYLKGLEEAAEQALAEGARILEDAAERSDSYNDRTGAYRAGTVAYVAIDGQPGAGEIDRAVAAVERENAEAVYLEDDEGADPTPDRPLIVLTAPTYYAGILEAANAGAHATLGPTVDQFSPAVHATIEQALKSRS